MLRHFLCFVLCPLVLTLSSTAARAQALPPAPPDPTPRPAAEAPAVFQYSAQLTGAYSSGAVERTLLSTSQSLNYARGRHFGAPLSGSFAYGRQAGRLKERELLVNLTPYYRLEQFRAYAVGAYERSSLRAIRWRTQVGGGPGWSFYRNDAGTREVALSNLILHEATQFAEGTARRVWRSSSRLKLAYAVGPLSVHSTTLYQPRVAHAADFRWSNATTVKVGITQQLALSVAYTYSFEQQVVEARSRGNTALTVGVSYTSKS